MKDIPLVVFLFSTAHFHFILPGWSGCWTITAISDNQPSPTLSSLWLSYGFGFKTGTILSSYQAASHIFHRETVYINFSQNLVNL